MIILLLTASFFRLYRLSSIPFGLNNDAAWEGSAAIDILRGNHLNYLPYAAEGWRGEGIIRLFVAFFTMVIGPDPLTIRLASVLFGIGLIVPLYLLIKLQFGRRIAFITTFFVAISGWHMTMSKTGWRAICVPFFTTLTFYFLTRGLKHNRKIDFILSGAMLAFSFYTYDAARIIPFLFVVWIFTQGFITPNFWHRYKMQLLRLTLAFAIFVLPMAVYGVIRWENFTSRGSFLFIGNQIEQAGNLSPFWDNVKTTFLLFNQSANGNDFFINEPLVDKPVSWLLPLGLVILLKKVFTKENSNYVFILLWLLFSLIPGILSIPNGNRGIGAIPAVYFVAGLGLLFLVDLLQKLSRGKGLLATQLLLGIFLLASAVISYKEYLGLNRRELVGFYPETIIVTDYVKSIRDYYDIYLTDNFPREILTYLLYNGGDPFLKNYIWLENRYLFLDVSRGLVDGSNFRKGKAFIMFATSENEEIADVMQKENRNVQSFRLWYKNDNISRPAALVVLIPSIQ